MVHRFRYVQSTYSGARVMMCFVTCVEETACIFYKKKQGLLRTELVE